MLLCPICLAMAQARPSALAPQKHCESEPYLFIFSQTLALSPNPNPRYKQIGSLEARALWSDVYESSASAKGQGARVLTHNLVVGAVLPVWDVLERAANRQGGARGLRVMRMQLSGELRVENRVCINLA